MSKYLDELKRACRAVPDQSDSRRIAEGESVWFAGRPAAADDGFICIAQDEDIRTVIREQDVQEVRKEGDFYLVRVSTEAKLLVRYERVTRANPVDCGCGAAHEDTTAQQAPIARQFGDTGPFGVPLGPCRLYVHCEYWGRTLVCWWLITCPGRIGSI